MQIYGYVNRKYLSNGGELTDMLINHFVVFSTLIALCRCTSEVPVSNVPAGDGVSATSPLPHSEVDNPEILNPERVSIDVKPEASTCGGILLSSDQHIDESLLFVAA